MSQPRLLDPGAEPSAPKGSLTWLIDWVERHPSCTLAGGEADMLVAEIHRLRQVISDIQHPDIYAKPG